MRCRLGGWLHDIGKVAIPDRILVKPSELDEHEWRIMRTHCRDRRAARAPGRGAQHRPPRRSATTTSTSTAAAIPTGSPATRFRSRRASWRLADAYSAITADRPYRRARTAAEALAELRAHAGSQHDGRVVEALARVLAAAAPELAAARRLA